LISMERVHIELQRVQNWLFSVPRLRAMIGANTQLGEFLRIELPKLARKGESWSLASAAGYPPADSADPLVEHDNPARDASDGILSRDGGHFEAIFSWGADVFARRAAEALNRQLRGLQFGIWVNDREFGKTAPELSLELPVLMPCEWTGRGLASRTVHQGDETAEVTLEVAARHEAARRAEEYRAEDLASLLRAKTKLKTLGNPEDFDSLSGGGYLAVIHADGNAVGVSQPTEGPRHAAFHHRNRVLLRRALQVAIDRTCEGAGAAPLVPLMLGGDDLLVVARANVALRFVVDLCMELERLQENRGAEFHLTLGVGVVFAKPTVPFHRLHEVAENLAASAKRRFRGFTQNVWTSVVDWAVYTTAWVDDPADMRRRDWLRGAGENVRVLSSRPMPVLGGGLSTLEGLVEAAGKLSSAPRSQLRYLVQQLPRGRALSELAFNELSKVALGALNQAGITSVWNNQPPASTSVLDLVEVFEINNLGRASGKQVGTRGNTAEYQMEKGHA